VKLSIEFGAYQQMIIYFKGAWSRTAIFRPHCSTTYVDAACCYQPSTVVCWSVCLSH